MISFNKQTLKLLLVVICAAFAVNATAQTPQAKKAAQAVFSLNTFRADGTMISTSHGVFINSKGEAVSQWKPFVGASKAVVIDASGKKYDVEGLIAANDLYDVCKFRVSGTTPAAEVATEMAAAKSQAYLACYSVKGQRLLHSTVANVETFSKPGDTGAAKKDYPLYIMDIKTPENVSFCPFVNSEGKVLGLLHSAGKDGQVTAISALFPAEMEFQALGQSSATLSKSHIATILPTEYKDAQLALILAGQQRKGDSYKALVEQFIRQYPNKPDGYEARARMCVVDSNFAAAAADMEKMISVSDDKAEAHYAYSNLILDKEVYMPDCAFAQWSLDKALSETRTAYSINPSGVYKQQEGKILYAQQKYKEALAVYLELQNTNMAGPETMYSAVQCSKAAGNPFEEVMALMDSTINVCPHPLTYQSAPYVMQRGILYQDHGDYRKAMIEYNSYEKLMVGNRLPADFYYNRFACEREARVYQQALDDITKVIEMRPRDPMYLCERASLQLRLNRTDECISDANKALILDSRNADAYALLGAAQCIQGKKHEGILNLEEAKSLGYENADALIKKYK